MKTGITSKEIDALEIDDLWDLSGQLQTLADYAAKRAETLAMERMMDTAREFAESEND
jgi:hypothetical protein